MLQSAPKFYEVAKRIIEITQDCVIVAHNAQFDYRILRTEFSRLGYDFERQNLCTVELAKKLIPEQPSYSLGKLVRALGIPMADRHRASGDALATAKLFKMLLDKDLEKEIVKSFIKTDTEKKLPTKFLEIVAKLPSTTGIYYIHKEDGEVIYIGKSRNIKKRVNQHFTSQSSKSKKIQQEVFEVTYEETGSELIALLKESEEIKVNKPKYNRLQKKMIFPWSIYSEIDKNGYLSLTIQPTNPLKNEVISFASQVEAKSFLFKITDEFRLCQKINKLDKPKTNCFPFQVNQCFGACINQENTEDYYNRVNQFLQKNKFHSQNLIIIDRGRNLQERSAILVENGIFKGIAYFELNYQVSKIDILKNIIVQMQHTRDAKHLILNHIAKQKVQKIIHF